MFIQSNIPMHFQNQKKNANAKIETSDGTPLGTTWTIGVIKGDTRSLDPKP